MSFKVEAVDLSPSLSRFIVLPSPQYFEGSKVAAPIGCVAPRERVLARRRIAVLREPIVVHKLHHPRYVGGTEGRKVTVVPLSRLPSRKRTR